VYSFPETPINSEKYRRQSNVGGHYVHCTVGGVDFEEIFISKF
jgi:hypothetical protein